MFVNNCHNGFAVHVQSKIAISFAEKRAEWKSEEVEALLQVYKMHREKFTTWKHADVWKRIASDLKLNFTAEQIKFKFGNLKSKYMKKKDNIKNTGDKSFVFPFFDQFHELFSSDARVSPIATCSNLLREPLEENVDLRAGEMKF